MTYPDVRSDSGLGGEWSDATHAGDDSAEAQLRYLRRDDDEGPAAV